MGKPCITDPCTFFILVHIIGFHAVVTEGKLAKNHTNFVRKHVNCEQIEYIRVHKVLTNTKDLFLKEDKLDFSCC